jgi:hypothetical protein
MPSLFITKLRANNSIDAMAGEVRRRFITDVSGQSAVYTIKLQEATKYVADHEASPSTATPGPHITAEAAATDRPVLTVAQNIVALGSAWLTVASPAIEAARLGGKARVDAAALIEDVEAERVAALAALDAIRA